MSWPPLAPMSAQQPSVPSVLGSPGHCALCQPLQFPLSWTLLATMPLSTQHPSVPSVLGSPGHCALCQPSTLQFPLSWTVLATMPYVNPAPFSSLCLGLSWPLCPMSAQHPSVPSVLDSPGHYALCQPSTLQFPLSWTVLATMPYVSPAPFSSLCLGLSWPLCPMSAQHPSVPSVLDSPGHYALCQPSTLQFPLSWTLLATMPYVNPAPFSSLCLGLSWPLCPMSTQHPSVPSVLDCPGHYALCQPSTLQFPLSWTLLATVPYVSPAPFSSLCLGLSWPLCPMSTQHPSVPSVLDCPGHYALCQPSTLQFPLSWTLLATMPYVNPAPFSSLCLGLSWPLCPMSTQHPSVPSVLDSPGHCALCQPSTLQFPLSWTLQATMPYVNPAPFSSLCLGLSWPLCPMSTQHPSVPSVLDCPGHYALCQPSTLQFPLSWTVLATMPYVSPAPFSSLCLGLSWPICPMSAQHPSVPSVLDSPGHYALCQPSTLQFPLSWTVLATMPYVSPAPFSSLCLGLSWPLCPMSTQHPSVPSVLDCPGHYALCQPSTLQFPLSWTLLATVPYALCHSPGHYDLCQPSTLQFPLSWTLLATMPYVNPAPFSSLCLGLATMPYVSPAPFSSLCLGLSWPLCPMSAQHPSVPSVLDSPGHYALCHPSTLQFPLSWTLLATMPYVSSVPSVLGSPGHCALCQPNNLQFPLSWTVLATVPYVNPAPFSSLCLGLSWPLCPMSPSTLQFPLSWTLLATMPYVSPAPFCSLCLGLSWPLCPMSTQHPSVPSVLDCPGHYALCQPSTLQFPLSWTLLATLCQPNNLQFPLSWTVLATVPYVNPAPFNCLPYVSVLFGLSWPHALCQQHPSVPSSWTLLATMPYVNPTPFSSLCLGLSWPLPYVNPAPCSLSFLSAQQPSFRGHWSSNQCFLLLLGHVQAFSTFFFSG